MSDYSQQRLWAGVSAADVKELREAIIDGDLLAVELLPTNVLVPVMLLAGWGQEQGIEIVDDYDALAKRVLVAAHASKHPDAPLAHVIAIFYDRGCSPGVAFYDRAGIPEVFEPVVGGAFDSRNAKEPEQEPFHVRS